MKKLLLVLLTAAMAITACGCSDGGSSSTVESGTSASLSEDGGITEQAALDSVEKLVENYDRFHKMYGYCVIETEDYDYDSLPVDEATGNKYAPVKAYGSIAEMKADTEKTVTAAYAEKNFYATAFNEEAPFYKEQDGKLYVNAEPLNLVYTWDNTSKKVISADSDKVVISLEYQDNYGEEKRGEFTLTVDNGSVKIDAVTLDLPRE